MATLETWREVLDREMQGSLNKIRDGLVQSLIGRLDWTPVTKAERIDLLFGPDGRMSAQSSQPKQEEESTMPTPNLNLKDCVMNAKREQQPLHVQSCPGCMSRLVALARNPNVATPAFMPNMTHAGPMAALFKSAYGEPVVGVPLSVGIEGIATFARNLLALTEDIKTRAIERPVVPVSEKMLKHVAERNRPAGYDVDIDG